MAFLIVYAVFFVLVVAVEGVISHRREIRNIDQASAATEREVYEVLQRAHAQMVAILQAARRSR
jgi:predicted Holliday junction resolvase-like endonuclease